jgi:hypothetical protein
MRLSVSTAHSKERSMSRTATFLKSGLVAAAFSAAAVLATLPAQAQKATEIELSYKDKKFTPAEISAPANTAVVIKLKNLSDKAMEFESKPLKIEKVVAAKGDAVINVRPQKAGSYKFVDEYNEDVAIGTLLVK